MLSITCGRGTLATLGDKAPTSRDTESLWRDEFSVFQERERFVNRRQLIKFLTLTSLGMFVGNVWILIQVVASPRGDLSARSNVRARWRHSGRRS